MAFQIIDDILDFVGTSNRLGKPVGSDLKNGIITLPVIVLMEQYPEYKPVQDMYVKTQSSNHAFNNHVLTPEGYVDFPKVNQDALEETLSFILEKWIIDQCYSIAKDYSAKATSSLKNLEANKYLLYPPKSSSPPSPDKQTVISFFTNFDNRKVGN